MVKNTIILRKWKNKEEINKKHRSKTHHISTKSQEKKQKSGCFLIRIWILKNKGKKLQKRSKKRQKSIVKEGKIWYNNLYLRWGKNPWKTSKLRQNL